MTRLLSLILLCVLAVCRSGAVSPPEIAGSDHVSTLIGLSSDSLLALADRWNEHHVMTDSALICYTIVANRYRADQPRAEQELAYRGWLGRWDLDFFRYCDYSLSVEDLLAAEEIAVEAGLPRNRLNYAFGCLWAALSTQTDDADLSFAEKSLDYMTDAFDESLRLRDWDTMVNAFLNIAVSGWVSGRLAREDLPQAAAMMRAPVPDTALRDMAMLNYHAYRALARDSIGAAADHFSRMLDCAGAATPGRQRAMALLMRGQLRGEQGRYAEGLDDLHRAMDVTYDADLPDARMVALRGLIDIYRSTGADSARREATSHLLHLQDTLHTARFLLKAEHLNLDRETLHIRNELVRSDMRRRLMTRVAGVAVAVIVVIGALLVMLIRANRRLRERNRALYRRNRAEQDIRPAAEAPALPAAAPAPKYRGSGLTDDNAARLAEAIAEVLRGEEIYRADFSLQRLAELTGSNPHYVSQVINQHFGCNYSRLINRARISEACRRLADTRRYGHYSVEGIAESVGFNSRSTFYDTFKKITDLTVGEYRSIARREGQHSDT